MRAVALVAFALLGVEGAATECERPFGTRSNHLNMDRFAAAVVADVAAALDAAGAHATARPPMVWDDPPACVVVLDV